MKASPRTGADIADKYEAASISFWISTDDAEQAIFRAKAMLSDEPWTDFRLVEVRPIERTDYPTDSPYLEYFDQAMIDKEACLIFTSPRSSAE